MTELDRVKKVCKWLIFNEVADNDKELADLLGYTKSSFSQIINGKVALSDKFIERLHKLDLNINKVWIKNGKGNMLLNASIIDTHWKDLADSRLEIINLQKREIERLEKELTDIKSLQKQGREVKGSSASGVAKSEEKLIK